MVNTEEPRNLRSIALNFNLVHMASDPGPILRDSDDLAF